MNYKYNSTMVQRIAAAMTVFLLLAATPQSNVRELCRQRIAGHYLSIFDRVERGKQLLILAARRLGEIQVAMTGENKKLRELTAKMQQSPFDEDLMNRTAQAASMVKQFEVARADQESLQEKTRTQLHNDIEVISELKQKLENVFTFEKVENSAGYNFQLRYKTPCPKFRQSCPIEGSERQALLNIFTAKTIPAECVLYTGLTAD